MTAGLEVRCRHRAGALDLGVELALRAGVTALVGPSGAGKTTLLHIAAGLLRADEAQVRWNEQPLDDTGRHLHVPPHRRRFGFVFQESRLFPHLSVRENLLYSPRSSGGAIRFADVVAALGLEPLLERRPGKLSGGERQRAALGRALLSQPELLLLDEPVSALDYPVRLRFMSYLEDIHRRFGLPMVFVTHDGDLVRQFAQEAVVMRSGRIVWQGAPGALTGHPTEGLTDPLANLLPATLIAVGDADTVDVDGVHIRVPASGLAPGTPVWLRILASDLLLVRGHIEGISARNVLPCRVLSTREEPNRIAVEVQAGARWWAEVLAETIPALGIGPGVELHLVAKATSFAVFAR